MVHFPLRAQADPVKATRAFALAAPGPGSPMCSPTGGHRHQLWPRGNLEYRLFRRGPYCRATVLAAGAGASNWGRMLGLQIPILPVRGQMWATEPLPPRVFHSISAAESPLLWSLSPGHDSVSPPELTHIRSRRVTRHLYGRQTRDGEVIFGGDRQMASYDKTVDVGGVEVNFGHAAEVLPFLRGCRSAGPVGPDAFFLGWPADHRQIPQRENLFIVSGWPHSGFAEARWLASSSPTMCTLVTARPFFLSPTRLDACPHWSRWSSKQRAGLPHLVQRLPRRNVESGYRCWTGTTRCRSRMAARGTQRKNSFPSRPIFPIQSHLSHSKPDISPDSKLKGRSSDVPLQIFFISCTILSRIVPPGPRGSAGRASAVRGKCRDKRTFSH